MRARSPGPWRDGAAMPRSAPPRGPIACCFCARPSCSPSLPHLEIDGNQQSVPSKAMITGALRLLPGAVALTVRCWGLGFVDAGGSAWARGRPRPASWARGRHGVGSRSPVPTVSTRPCPRPGVIARCRSALGLREDHEVLARARVRGRRQVRDHHGRAGMEQRLQGARGLARNLHRCCSSRCRRIISRRHPRPACRRSPHASAPARRSGRRARRRGCREASADRLIVTGEVTTSTPFWSA